MRPFCALMITYLISLGLQVERAQDNRAAGESVVRPGIVQAGGGGRSGQVATSGSSDGKCHLGARARKAALEETAEEVKLARTLPL